MSAILKFNKLMRKFKFVRISNEEVAYTKNVYIRSTRNSSSHLLHFKLLQRLFIVYNLTVIKDSLLTSTA